MIVNFVVHVLSQVAVLLVSLIPAGSGVPSWVTSLGSDFGLVAGWASSVGVWVPWPVIFTVVAAVMACWGIGLAVKLVRIAISYVTLGGGSAG